MEYEQAISPQEVLIMLSCNTFHFHYHNKEAIQKVKDAIRIVAFKSDFATKIAKIRMEESRAHRYLAALEIGT